MNPFFRTEWQSFLDRGIPQEIIGAVVDGCSLTELDCVIAGNISIYEETGELYAYRVEALREKSGKAKSLLPQLSPIARSHFEALLVLASRVLVGAPGDA